MNIVFYYMYINNYYINNYSEKSYIILRINILSLPFVEFGAGNVVFVAFIEGKLWAYSLKKWNLNIFAFVTFIMNVLFEVMLKNRNSSAHRDSQPRNPNYHVTTC